MATYHVYIELDGKIQTLHLQARSRFEALTEAVKIKYGFSPGRALFYAEYAPVLHERAPKRCKDCGVVLANTFFVRCQDCIDGRHQEFDRAKHDAERARSERRVARGFDEKAFERELERRR